MVVSSPEFSLENYSVEFKRSCKESCVLRGFVISFWATFIATLGACESLGHRLKWSRGKSIPELQELVCTHRESMGSELKQKQNLGCCCLLPTESAAKDWLLVCTLDTEW